MIYSSFTDALRSLAAHRPQVVREREILRLAATLGGDDGKKTVRTARDEILKWVTKRAGGQLPPEAWDHKEFEYLVGGRDCVAVRCTNDAGDIWAIRANDPDKSVALRVWTTEVVIGDFPKEKALLSVRLLVSSPEPELHIEPAVPGLVYQLASECGLYHRTDQLTADLWLIESEDDVERLINTLIDPERLIPVFVLTVPDGATDMTKPLISPDSIAHATLGIALTTVLPTRFTWALTERFGKRLSVFDGAIRVYLPGFTEDANPYGGHELVLADRLSTRKGKSYTSARLRQTAATESLRRLRLGQDVLSYAAVRAQSLDIERIRLEQKGASSAEQLSAAQAQIERLKEDLTKAQDESRQWTEYLETTENRARIAEAQQTSSAHRIQQLLSYIKTQGGHPDGNISDPETWEEFADWCEENLVGRVLLSSRARREVKASEFGGITVATQCLRWLANEYRERRLNGGDGDLRIPVKSGILNDRCGADSFPFDWRGKRFEVEWHIKNGGNTRNPGRCLRIYYFWDDESQQVVIASMPAHIRTKAT